jgi:hypothetical protein
MKFLFSIICVVFHRRFHDWEGRFASHEGCFDHIKCLKCGREWEEPC